MGRKSKFRTALQEIAARDVSLLKEGAAWEMKSIALRALGSDLIARQFDEFVKRLNAEETRLEFRDV